MQKVEILAMRNIFAFNVENDEANKLFLKFKEYALQVMLKLESDRAYMLYHC